MKLNQKQIEAINHKEGPCLVTAPPGAGKTETIVQRIVKLIKDGVNPNRILCITFTNKASTELKERVAKNLGVKKIPIFVGTFHTLCSIILRKFGHDIGYNYQLTILDQDDQKTMLKKIYRRLAGNDSKNEKNIDFDKLVTQLNSSRESYESLGELEERFSEKFNDDIYYQIAKDYLDELYKTNTIDFTGLLYNTVNLLRDYKSIRDTVKQKWNYVLVDEAQDTSLVQFEFLYYIIEDHKNIMVIADLNQSIYLFRNARYQNIIDFFNKYKNCKHIVLNKNYRSTPEIINPSIQLINHNKGIEKTAYTTDNPNGYPIRVDHYTTPQEEAKSIAKKIKYYIEEEGYYGHEIAILYRLNALSMELQLELSSLGIPFRVIGSTGFFNLKEVKDTLALVKFLVNRRDSISFHRSAELFKGIGESSIGWIENKAKEEDENLYNVAKKILNHEYSDVGKRVVKFAEQIIKVWGIPVKNVKPDIIIDQLLKSIDYDDYLKKKYANKAEKKKDNIQALLDHAAIYHKQKGANIIQWLNNITLSSENDKESKEHCVNLMSCHACKGLEFDIVFMPSVEYGILPHSRAIIESKDPIEAIAEERRICYVSMTRAKKHLHMSFTGKRLKRNSQGFLQEHKAKPSQFLIESGLVKDEKKNT